MDKSFITDRRILYIKMFEKLRAFADIGRTQGITTTASVAIVGALTSTQQVQWYHIIYFTLLACFAHTALNTYIALGDIKLDSKTYVPSRNPVAAGLLSKKEAMNFFYIGTLLSAVLIVIPFLYSQSLIFSLSILCFIPAYSWLVWYGWLGKKYLLSYDFSFSISYGFFVLFGVFATGGTPTVYTWLFIAVVVFAATAFAQWENGLKDANADRSAGVRSFAVITNVMNNKKLYATHPYFLYGVVLKSGFILFCLLAYLQYTNRFYLLFILMYGIPSQAFIMYRFLKKDKSMDHRKTILLDVTLTGILGYSVILGRFDSMGPLIVLLLIIYLIIGYFVGSYVQSQCEFKFSRFSKTIS